MAIHGTAWKDLIVSRSSEGVGLKQITREVRRMLGRNVSISTVHRVLHKKFIKPSYNPCRTLKNLPLHKKV